MSLFLFSPPVTRSVAHTTLKTTVLPHSSPNRFPIDPVPPPLVIPAETPSARIEHPARGQPQTFIIPDVIEPTIGTSSNDDAESDNILSFPIKRTKRGRKKSSDTTYRVDYVKASRNTFAFRIRWKEPDGNEPAVYVSRVSDRLFKSITKGKAK